MEYTELYSYISIILRFTDKSCIRREMPDNVDLKSTLSHSCRDHAPYQPTQVGLCCLTVWKPKATARLK